MEINFNWTSFIAAALAKSTDATSFGDLMEKLKEVEKGLPPKEFHKNKIDDLIYRGVLLKRDTDDCLRDLLQYWKTKEHNNNIYFNRTFIGYYLNDAVEITGLFFTDDLTNIIVMTKDENEDDININIEDLEIDKIHLINLIYDLLFKKE